MCFRLYYRKIYSFSPLNALSYYYYYHY